MRRVMQNLTIFDGLERRSRIRFPIALAARYAIDGRQEMRSAGETVNIISSGALIKSGHDMLPGTSIRVVIEWPILMDHWCSVALHTQGAVVRSDRGLVAI